MLVKPMKERSTMVSPRRSNQCRPRLRAGNVFGFDFDFDFDFGLKLGLGRYFGGRVT